MKYLNFSKLNKKYFLFLSYFIFSIVKDIVNRHIASIDDIIQTFNKYYVNTLSDLLSIIPLIIIKVRSKSISTENREIQKDFRKNSALKYIYAKL